jgi:hypothetical protein
VSKVVEHLGFQHLPASYLLAIFLYIGKEHRPIQKMVVILFSPEINFDQGNYCRLIEYFKTISYTKYKYNTM